MQFFDQFAAVDDFYSSSDFDDLTAQLCLASELDDFDNLVGWVDFTVQVFDKFAEVDDFDNSADFDDFTVQVDPADLDD